jgi:multidrug resistance efflux pump
MEVFRKEALASYEGSALRGDVLRFEQVRIAYGLALFAALAAFVFVSLFSVDEYATGPAVVRMEGRRTLTTSAAGSVDAVFVKPGQWVEAGATLTRLYSADEKGELERSTREFNANLARLLVDPNDQEAKASMAAYRIKRDQALGAVEQRILRAPQSGFVTDIRARVGQHVNAGDVLLAIAPKESARVSLDAMVSADYLPMLHKGAKMRFELDGFHYEYADLEVAEVAAEALGPAEVARYLGRDHEGAVPVEPGAKVRVSAKLPAATFTSEGQPYGYFDGLTGNASIQVRREPLLVTLVPALRAVLP